MTKQKKLAFIFPGQGAQYVGMAKDFYAEYPEAKQTFEEADDRLGRTLSHTIFYSSESELTETKNSQPAIYVVSLAILRVLQKLFGNLAPYACAGLSLGEYSAVTAANILDYASGLILVQHRGLFMHQACEEIPGTMAVVLGMDDTAVEAVVEELKLPHDLWAANFNCPGQVVISGTKKGVEAASTALLAKGAKRVLPLQVHGAFHSGLMQSARQKLQSYIEEATLYQSNTKLAMNTPGDFVESKDEIKRNLINQVTQPVRWHRSISAIANSGIDLFIEIGCGKTLAGMNKRIGMQAPTVSVEKIEDIASLEKALQETA